MPNTDPIGEALGTEGTSSLIPSIPPIFNNGLDSRDSRPLPYPQSLDSGNFPISDAEDSSLIDSIIEPPGSIVNELNADAEADTLILNQTDSSSLIKELSAPPK